jgi:Tfp pilus assembly protein PilV
MRQILRGTSGKKNERGFSVLEAMFAAIIMTVGIAGLMALFVVAAAKNAGQGDQATRTTEFAQDKMEQLLALNYNDAASQVAGATTTATGGAGLSQGGSLSVASPTVNYVDYVDSLGTVSSSATGARYIREWLISPPTQNVKTVTVTVTALFSADIGTNMHSLAPSTTLIAMKQQN